MGVRLSAVEEAGARTFEEFFRKEHPRLYRTLLLVTGDRGEADDLAQEAMARVYERWDRVGTAGSPVGYLYRTAFNLNRRRIRRLALRRRADRLESRPQAEPHSVEDRQDVIRAVASLPLPLREAVVLVEWLDLDTAEAGRILGIEPVSVRGRLYRAREMLRAVLRVTDE
jgi:RNA polymerase sigma factor (sigma-70 family)